MNKSEKMNVVYFYFDELRNDALGCYGSREFKAKTPAIDAIAQKGIRFSNCYCNSPVCVPSRMSMMTGLYPEDTGVYGNEASLAPFKLKEDYDTYTKVLERHGYKTANFGKTHLPNGMRVFQTMNQSGSGMDLGLGKEAFTLEKITPTGPIVQNLGSVFPGARKYGPEKIKENAIEWLEENKDKGPFFLRLSYLQPHTPVIVQNAYKAIYENENFSGKIMPTDHLSGYEKEFAELLNLVSVEEDQRVLMKKYYYALVSWVDHEVGEVMAYLDKNHMLDDTMIIIGADHGVALGEGGKWSKFTYHKVSQQVPLIISSPKMVEKDVEEMRVCSNIDFPRTLFGLLDIDAPEQFKGTDLLNTSDYPEEVYASIGYGSSSSYPMQYDAVGRYKDNHGWPRRSCIRTGRYRLDINTRMDSQSVKVEDEDMFFVDCLKFPDESVNMANNPAYKEIEDALKNKLYTHCKDSLEYKDETLGAIEKKLKTREFFKELDANKNMAW